MPMPPTVTKKSTKKGQVEYSFTSGVDRANYTIKELCNGALRDCGKILTAKVKQIVPVRTGNLKKNVGSSVNKKTSVLTVGYKKAGWYGGLLEKGTKYIAAGDYIWNTTKENIDTLREIQGQYLSAISDEREAERMLNKIENEKEEE